MEEEMKKKEKVEETVTEFKVRFLFLTLFYIKAIVKAILKPKLLLLPFFFYEYRQTKISLMSFTDHNNNILNKNTLTLLKDFV